MDLIELKEECDIGEERWKFLKSLEFSPRFPEKCVL
jgi:hypothetical protein